MRTLLIGALLACGALPLGAQQDSAARRDSLLERERRRIRGEATVATVGTGVSDAAGPRFRFGIGVASPSTWLEDANGIDVSSGIAPTLAVEVRFPRSPGTEWLVGLRGSRASTSIESFSTRDGDAIWVVDLFAGGSQLVRERLTMRGGLVGALVAGGGDIAPFAEASRFAPGVELGGALRVPSAVPLWIALGAQALRYGGSGDAPTGAEAGAVYRLIVELRHGR